jgi:hypothetical protein
LNTFTRTGLALALAGLLIGCGSTPRYADAPAATRFENSNQLKLQAAHHWQLIADHFANDLIADLQGKLGSRSLHIPQPGGEQAFVEGFRELLITALVQRGVPVSTDTKNALTVDVRYSIYKFSRDRAENTYFYGSATALAVGVAAIGGLSAERKISDSAAVSAGVKLLPVIAGLESLSWLVNEQMGRGRFANGEIPQSEILLTASVTDNHQIVARRSNIYYTKDNEANLYWNRPAQGGVILKLSGEDCGGKPCAR